MKTVIKVENLGKQYRLGQVGTGTLSHDINRAWHRMRGKEDPYLKVGEMNDRSIKGESEWIWALKDINFEVKQGEVLGIIGKNGAGKSTLLKILSQITSPSIGEIKIKGRIAALLEVGTGFHPELTGRENVFLNGAVLGMSKAEITDKFDEIVEFSGIGKYIDTPVKRFSSGMLVRLGFAVAAHLEPEILIVDEVLAVGDVEFQNKCLGKMNEVSKSGRTIIFVSHNMQAISQLCSRAILLENGTLTYNGNVKDAVKKYLSTSINTAGPVFDLSLPDDRKGSGLARFTKLEVLNKGKSESNFVIGDDLELKLTLKTKGFIKTASIAIHLFDYDESIIANIENIDSDFIVENLEGEKTYEINFKNINLYPNTYKLGFWIGSTDGSETYDHLLRCAEFNVIEGSPIVKRTLSKNGGILFLRPEWK
ncbi:MAG: hypothetical protein A3F72_13660 [Bacteroidetes bacterium RIFCSPLOWO2_12_FULL_35_15]|nr:MAG: hypothetical protein A3F72_13660 [Bacteroidetes bacterium RIFCSPLOWO2_12_FULL_35_15]